MKRWIIVFALVMLGLGRAGVALPDQVTWSIDGVYWTWTGTTGTGSGGTISGNFTSSDPVVAPTYTITAWNIRVVPPSGVGFPIGSFQLTNDPYGSAEVLNFGSYTQLWFDETTASHEYDVRLDFSGGPGQLDPGRIPLMTGSGNGEVYVYLNATEAGEYGYPTSGSLDPVPLPPSAFLLGSGLLGLLGLRRFRKG
jgi:hypothetical protein